MAYAPTGDGAIVAYTDRLVVSPGQPLRLYGSSEVGDYRVSVVALGEDSLAHRWTPAFAHDRLDLGVQRGLHQRANQGSCAVLARVGPSNPRESVTLQLWAWPTLVSSGASQTLLAAGADGLSLRLTSSGHLRLSVPCDRGIAELRSGQPLVEREWQRITVMIDPSGDRVVLGCEPVSRWLTAPEWSSRTLAGAVLWSDDPLVLGAQTTADPGAAHPSLRVTEPFNGKLARPWVAEGLGDLPSARAQQRIDDEGPSTLGRTLAHAWALGAANGIAIPDQGPQAAPGVMHNGPTLAVTGPMWSGTEVDFRRAPREYDAIHFHEDDLDDARWRAALELDVPADCRSGLYAFVLEGQSARDVVPFVVAPPVGTATAHAAFWVPTYSYLAYANQHRADLESAAFERLSVLDAEVVQPSDRILARRPDIGLSLYDCHRDGSPCCYSSALRPIVNMRPGEVMRHTGRPRHFSADLRFLQWLTRKGVRVDVVTDHDVDGGGVDLLRRYRVVMTGSHPEYVTDAIHRATEAYVTDGGRLMYLGGNGFYWVTGVDPLRPHVIEVRRGFGGANPTGESPPGESHLSTTGEPGGIWRQRGRAPQRVVGVGMSAMGWGAGDGYAWLPGSERDELRFISRGVDRSKPLGAGVPDHPWGAATDEIDRADVNLGTPLHATVVATSAGRHDGRFAPDPADEDVMMSLGATSNVRADVVYATSPRGGRLFAVGSMGWTDAFEACPDVERVTENVLEDFLDG